MTEPAIDSGSKPTSGQGNRRNKTIIAVIVAGILILCILPICIIALLSLLGPQIGEVFSEIMRELGTPAP